MEFEKDVKRYAVEKTASSNNSAWETGHLPICE